MSMMLAIPHVRVWTRSLYRQIPGIGLYTTLVPESRTELAMLRSLLVDRNGVPFVSEMWELDLWTDTGEVGWGAHISGLDIHGLLPAHLVGQS